MTRFFIVLAAVAAGSVLVGARQEPEFHSGTHTVSIYATVVDPSGRLVLNLNKDDFEVFDNGKRQDLTLFANDIQPITIVVMLDRSSSMTRNFGLERDAAEQFVNALMPGDKARLGNFSNRIDIEPPQFTTDRNALIRFLHEDLQEGGPTPLWNATAAAMTALAHEQGRRVVLVFTDGEDSPGWAAVNVTVDEIRTRAQVEEIMVYAIGLAETCGPYQARAETPSGGVWLQRRGGPSGGGGRGGPVRGPGGPGRGPIGLPPIGRLPPTIPPPIDRFPPTGRVPDLPRTGDGEGEGVGYGRCLEANPDPDLRSVADEGGGGYFELHGTDDLRSTFARVADELHHQYMMAFRAPVLDGQVHRIDVRVGRPDLTVRARKSYLAPSK